MLIKIAIQNYALISHLEIALHVGMQVITGETGAGKSIILGALRLLMGERADAKNVTDTSAKSIVEGTFLLSELFRVLFEEEDVDFEPETIIRREILPTGKSRAFINDTPVTLEVLRKISAALLDIHSQFETASLFTEEFQFKLLDGLSGNTEAVAAFRSHFLSYQKLQKQLLFQKEELSKHLKEKDFNQFLLEELEEAQLDTSDVEALENRLKTQENIGVIGENLQAILSRFDAENIGLLDGMLEVKNRLVKIAALSHEFTEVSARLEQNYLDVKDILFELQNKSEELEQDPATLERLQNQYSALQSLLVKHNVQDVSGLVALRENLAAGQSNLEQLEEAVAATEQKLQALHDVLTKEAAELHKKREKGTTVFAQKMQQELHRLGLEKASIAIELQPANAFSPFGKERISILFQANSGYALKPIQTAVSGGERSRVMLAVKKILAENSQLPTLILDEIDTGVSGRIAGEMGVMMREMSQDLQLIVITHLPQVAAKGKDHFRVQKMEQDGKTMTTILPLTPEERVQEIAGLLSGDTITPAAVAQATELMQA